MIDFSLFILFLEDNEYEKYVKKNYYYFKLDIILPYRYMYVMYMYLTSYTAKAHFAQKENSINQI